MTTKHTKTDRFNSTRMVTALASLLALCLIFATARAHASLPTSDGVILTSIAAAPNGGFWVQIDSGGTTGRTLATQGAPQFENVPKPGSIASIPGRAGYFVVSPWGDVYNRGDAPDLCGELSKCSGFPSTPTKSDWIVALAATPDGFGFWAVGSNGKLWTVGDAPALGDVTKDSHKPTGIVATLSGNGYYIVMEDGGVYSFGDAVFYGSTGGKKPGGHTATGLAASLGINGKIDGYWMVATDGGIFTFGDAPFLGSTGGNNGGSSITGITALPRGLGYAWVHANGGVGLSDTLSSGVLTSQYSGLVIGLPDESTTPGVQLQQFPLSEGNQSQQWDIWPTTRGGNLVQLVNINSGLCVEMAGSVVDAKIIQAPCKGKNVNRDDQLWTMYTDGDFRQFSTASNAYYRLGVTSTANGAPVKLVFLGAIVDYSIVNWRFTKLQ